MKVGKFGSGGQGARFAVLALVIFGLGSVFGEPVSARLDGMLPEAILRVQSSVTPSELQFGEANIAGYAILGEVVQLPADAAEQIVQLMQNPGAFESGDKARCPFAPGLSIRFIGNGSSADLLICFGCDEVAIVPDGGSELGTLYSMPQTTRDVMLGVAKSILSGDEGIQALPAVRRDPSGTDG